MKVKKCKNKSLKINMIVTDEGFFTKAKALDELAHRQASDVQYSEDYYHPWSLPKGNFKHRMLSTGWHQLFGILHYFKEWTSCRDGGYSI